MTFADDTIAAIATPAGTGGVGIIRVSGPRAIEIVASTIGVATDALDRTVRVGWACDRAGHRLDQVIAFAMRSPGSFTGEDVAELHGHGGSFGMSALLAAVVERGARVAEPGEFTRRAVANNKLDLSRAEALLDVIHAGSERAMRLAQANLSGRLGDEARILETRGLAILAEIEGRIDFPDEDLDLKSDAWVDTELAALEQRCIELSNGFREGRAIRDGISVALVGPVNAGKSSLLNALVGQERALVAADPGTTRDYLEITNIWNGIRVTIVDTAGLRSDPGEIEQRGIALGEARVESADVVLVLNDGSVAWDDGSRYGDRALAIRSKGDLLSGDLPAATLVTSARTSRGLDELKLAVLARAGVADREGSEQPMVTTLRQHQHVVEARDAFAAARRERGASSAPEIIALELRTATQALARLRGVEVGERVLDEVFARFCIGK